VNVQDESSISARVRYAELEPIQAAVRAFARDIRARHPEILSLRWFGSWAHGDATVGSDVDLCIIVDKSDKRSRDGNRSLCLHGGRVRIAPHRAPFDEKGRRQRHGCSASVRRLGDPAPTDRRRASRTRRA
jgi:hypothetical protein